MYYALNKDKEIVYAQHLQSGLESHHHYYCPQCSQKLILKRSRRGKLFFCHQQSCQTNVAREIPLESSDHRLGKEILYHHFYGEGLRGGIEFFLSEINQRADLYFYDSSGNNRRIFEFQNTPISFAELKSRTQAYQKIADQVFWFGNYKDFMKFKKTAWSQKLLHSDQQYGGYYIPTVNLHDRKIIFITEIPLLYQKHQLAYFEWEVNLKEDKIIKKVKCSKTYVHNSWADKQIQLILRNQQYRREILNLYQKGIILQELPPWFFDENWEIFMANTPTWLFFTYLYGYIHEIKGSFTLTDILLLSENANEILWGQGMLSMMKVKEDTLEKVMKLFIEKNLIAKQGRYYYSQG